MASSTMEVGQGPRRRRPGLSMSWVRHHDRYAEGYFVDPTWKYDNRRAPPPPAARAKPLVVHYKAHYRRAKVG